MLDNKAWAKRLLAYKIGGVSYLLDILLCTPWLRVSSCTVRGAWKGVKRREVRRGV